MIPSRGFNGLFFKVAGDDMLLMAAEYNLLKNMSKIKNGRTHTFLTNNGQTAEGISRNFGADRCYTWANTIIDCRAMSRLPQDAHIEGFLARIRKSAGFQAFQKTMEERCGGYLTCDVFLKVIKGEENKRYNIRLESKYEAFDIVRVGLKISAPSADDYNRGLQHLLDWERRYHPDYEGVLPPMPHKVAASAAADNLQAV